MKNVKKICSLCLIFVVVIAAAITSLFVLNKRTANPHVENQEESIDWKSLGVYFASTDEASEVEDAPESMKGGAAYLGPGTQMDITGGTVQYHEAVYGGGFFIDKGATLNISGGTIRCNGAMYGGAIFINEGGTLNIMGGSIEYNNAEEGPAIYARGNCKITYSDGVDVTSMMNKNEYADFGKFYINYYVDGVLTDYSEQKIAAFRNDETPLTYEECNGWFRDEDMVNPIEEGDVFQYTTSSLDQGDLPYKTINLYTKEATVDKFTYTLVNSINYKAIAKGSGNFVMPKEYKGIAVSQFEKITVSCTSFYLNSNILTIPAYAFQNCTALKTLTIPNNVISIGNGAFQYCSALKTIHVSDRVTSLNRSLFSYCSALESIVIPASVTKIDTYAFLQCTSLTSVEFESNSKLKTIEESSFRNMGPAALTSIVIPASVTTISSYAFDNCGSLITVEFEANSKLETIGSYAFSNTGLESIVIPASVITISSSAFQNDSSLKIVTFEADSKLETIGSYAFCNTVLESIEIPASVTTISSDAFYSSSLTLITVPKNCTVLSLFKNVSTLKTVIMSDGWTEITERQFEGWTQINTINIPASVTTVFDYAFNNCRSLTTVEFKADSKLETIGSYAFYNTGIKTIEIPASVTKISSSAFYHCKSLTNVTFAAASKLTTIGESAFRSSALTSVTIPASVITIGTYAFGQMESLTNLEFEQNSKLKTIGESAFRDTKLTSVVIPATVGTIDDFAFCQVSSLSEITIESNSQLAYIGSYAFYYTAIESIVIPEHVSVIDNQAFDGTTNLRVIVNLSDLEIYSGVDNSLVGRLGMYADMVFGNEVIWTESFDNGVMYRTYTAKHGGNVQFKSSHYTNVQEQLKFKVATGVEDNTLSTYTLAQDTNAIGYSVFKGNLNLTHITIPENMKDIGYNAFNGCFNLAVVCNLSSDIHLTDMAGLTLDYGCLNYYLAELYDEEVTVEHIVSNELNYLIVKKNGVQVDKIATGISDEDSYQYIFTTELDSDTTIVGYAAFRDTSITTLVLNDGLRKIAYNAFRDCYELTQIFLANGDAWQENIPSSLVEIGAKAFMGANVDFSDMVANSDWKYWKYSTNGDTWSDLPTLNTSHFVFANPEYYYKKG